MIRDEPVHGRLDAVEAIVDVAITVEQPFALGLLLLILDLKMVELKEFWTCAGLCVLAGNVARDAGRRRVGDGIVERKGLEMRAGGT